MTWSRVEKLITFENGGRVDLSPSQLGPIPSNSFPSLSHCRDRDLGRSHYRDGDLGTTNRHCGLNGDDEIRAWAVLLAMGDAACTTLRRGTSAR